MQSKHYLRSILVFIFFSLFTSFVFCDDLNFSGEKIDPSDAASVALSEISTVFTVHGRLVAPRELNGTAEFYSHTRVIVNYGEYLGFIG